MTKFVYKQIQISFLLCLKDKEYNAYSMLAKYNVNIFSLESTDYIPYFVFVIWHIEQM